MSATGMPDADADADAGSSFRESRAEGEYGWPASSSERVLETGLPVDGKREGISVRMMSSGGGVTGAQSLIGSNVHRFSWIDSES